MAQIINKDVLVDKLQLMDAFANSSKKATKAFVEDFFDLIAKLSQVTQFQSQVSENLNLTQNKTTH